ncbi:MAG: hypothetical protein UU95_C0017G0022 [Parcubacteria group bacterium GW2011_GWC2_42_12]|nr:MAG: hypothetical protein UU95_C0017G0022 [Parcubacteria group bacterium GW2011_GWC2_42_12]
MCSLLAMTGRMCYNLSAFMKIKYSIFIIFFGIIIFIFPTASQSSIDCCYHECRLTEPARCDGAWVQECKTGTICDIDPYNDWCNKVNCAASGKVCQNGVCVGSSCTVSCPTGPGCLNSLVNGQITSGECCGSGDCYQCRTGYVWDSADRICKASAVPACGDGTPYNSCSTNQGAPYYCNSSGSLVENSGSCGCRNNWVPGSAGTYCCDNQCNSSCSTNSGCTAIPDPDCACQSGNGCCGRGCTNANDSDCAVIPDTTNPRVDSFTAALAAGTVTATYTITDETQLKEAQLWRAAYDAVNCSTGQELNCGWGNIPSGVAQKPASGLSSAGTLTDTPGVGAWWYGIHAVDQANNWAPEATPRKIVISALCTPNGCNGVCPAGCTAAQDPDCGLAGCCGNGVCNTGESNATCSGDCAVLTCTSFTYSAWGTCANGAQTRTVFTSSPAGCTGGMPITTQSCDSIKPAVDSFTVATGPVITWSVSDTGGSHLARVEVWRAPDASGNPGTWAEVASLRQNIASQNIDTHSGSATDNPDPGVWWYGLHAVDQANNWAPEATPRKITIVVANLPSIPTNANAICLYNFNDATSAKICNYYLQKRPGASKLGLDVPDSIFDNTLISSSVPTPRHKEWSSLADFINYIKKPLDDYVAAHPELKITHVAIAKGLPIRISMQVIPPIEYIDALTGQPVRITQSHMSNTTAFEPELDYSLCAVIDEACSKKLYNRDNRAKLLPDANNDFSPYWRARSARLLQHFDAADYQSFGLGMRPKYVSSNLNGYNLADIKKMIDRAQATPPDLRSAKWVVDGNATDIINNDIWEEEFATASKFLSATAGIPQNNIVLEKTDVAPLDLSALGGPVVGYYGFGTHHPNYFFDWALRLVKAPVANRAVITAYESFNGNTFSIDPYTPWSVYLRATDESYFSKPPDFISSIAFGGTNYSRSFSGGYGNVYEPGPPGADHAEDFFLSYASGMTLAEAFFNTWESPNNIAWGDPLMRITDSTDNSKPNGLACADNSECRLGSQCLADDLGFKFCFTPENGSCLFARPRDPTPELRLYNISAPNGGTICESADPYGNGKSLATLSCSNSEWRRTACAPGGQCGYTTTPNVYYDYLVGSFAGASCKSVIGQECTVDADCSNAYCDADMSGVKRCHTTASSCAGGEAGNAVPNGAYACATDQRYKAQCNNAVWSSQTQCQNGCRFGSCLEDFYNPATHAFNLMPQRSYFLTLPVNTGSKKISEVFINPLPGVSLKLWGTQTRSWSGGITFDEFDNVWDGIDSIIKPGDVFNIVAPAQSLFNITGKEFDSALPFKIKNTHTYFGMPYCAAGYTASKLLREISARDNRCAAVSTGNNGVDPVLYWSEVENSEIANAIKQDFQILPFEGYFVKCAEGVDFTFTPSCPAP